MASRNDANKWYWPTFGNIADAEQASNGAFWAAVCCAVVTTLFATIAVFSEVKVGGINASAYIDAVLFALIAWRIRKRSKAFAIIGLCLFVLEKVFQYTTQPLSTMSFGIVVAIILLLLFINGVRGTFAYHRFLDANAMNTPLET